MKYFFYEDKIFIIHEGTLNECFGSEYEIEESGTQ